MSELSDYKRRQRSNALSRLVANTTTAVVAAVKGKADYSLKTTPGIAYDVSAWEKGLQVSTFNPFPNLLVGRASLGSKYADPTHLDFYQQSKVLQLLYGAFHFFVPNNVQPQIDIYMQQMETVGFDKLPPFLDLEYDPGPWPNGMRGEQLADQVKFWLDGVEQRAGKRPIIYTNANYWSFTFFDPTGKKNPDNVQAPSWTNDCRLWLGWYPDQVDVWNSPPVGVKRVWPSGFAEWVMWQYAANGRSNGYPANDLNIISQAFMTELGIGV